MRLALFDLQKEFEAKYQEKYATHGVVNLNDFRERNQQFFADLYTSQMFECLSST